MFAHGSIDDAVHQNESGMQLGPGPLANTVGVDTYGQYGACDFDGDGKDDLFLATGASWWYMSSAKMYWVYLNSYPERLHQLALGKFDADSRCDVFAVHGNDWVISSGGTGAWRSLGSFGVPFDQLRFGDFNGDGITDMFRRAPDGQWSIISPGVYPWTLVQSSSFPLNQLRFGDFNGDGVTDVIAVQDGHWSMSVGARSTWQPLNLNLSDSLASVLIADVDGNGSADILRYVPTGNISGRWDVSWGGRTGWQSFAAMSWPESWRSLRPAYGVRGYVGRFSSPLGGRDLLTLDFTRQSKIFNKASGTFGVYSYYAY